jgi:hypothetical protein
MKAKISQEQMNKLLEAARFACDPGACRYVKDGEPCCVIAQLAVLHGANVSVLVEFDVYQEFPDDLPGSQEVSAIENLALLHLEEWNKFDLRQIQAVWDRRTSGEEALLAEIELVFEVAG